MSTQFHTLRPVCVQRTGRYNWENNLPGKKIEGCSNYDSSSNISEKLLVLKINNLAPSPPELALELTYLYFLKIFLFLISLKNTSNFSQTFSLFKSLNQFIKVQSIILLCFGLFIFKIISTIFVCIGVGVDLVSARNNIKKFGVRCIVPTDVK